MQTTPQNKAGQNTGSGYYVQRCLCGNLIDVPVSGEMVFCSCKRRHRWLPEGSDRRRTYGVKIARPTDGT